jgi:hypothetical protein
MEGERSLLKGGRDYEPYSLSHSCVVVFEMFTCGACYSLARWLMKAFSFLDCEQVK